VPTSLPATEITVEPTTEITTEPTISSEDALLLTSTSSVNYDETLASMQSQIDAQAEKNTEQDAAIETQSEQIGILQQLIDAILGFLGMK
jgi:hypothetical protein